MEGGSELAMDKVDLLGAELLPCVEVLLSCCCGPALGPAGKPAGLINHHKHNIHEQSSSIL